MSAAKLGKTEAAILSALKLDRESYVAVGRCGIGTTYRIGDGLTLSINDWQRRALKAAKRLEGRGLVSIWFSPASVCYSYGGRSEHSFFVRVELATASRDEKGGPR